MNHFLPAAKVKTVKVIIVSLEIKPLIKFCTYFHTQTKQ